MGFLEVLTLIFIVLKLTGIITWGWLVVFLPLIIAVVFYLAWFVFFVAMVAQTGGHMPHRRKRKKR
jgi:hypothetical protein